jgi:hypothetical protein
MPLKPGLYLEVGVGANDFEPRPTMLVDAEGNLSPRRFVRGAHYLGIDMPLQLDRSWRNIHGWFLGDAYIDDRSVEDKESIARRLAAARDIVRTLRPGEAIDFALADGLHLPLGNRRAREVYMSDIVGSQLIDDVLQEMLREARRVLLPEGELVLRECRTPFHAPDNLQDMLLEAGFRAPHFFDQGTSGYRAKVAEYGVTELERDGWYSPGSFFATASPRDTSS